MTAKAAFVAVLAALGWSLLAEHVVEGWLQPLWIPLADLAVGWALVGSGLVGMAKRPAQAAGRRLVLAGLLWWVGNFQLASDPYIGAVGFAFQGYHDVVLALLVLSFPAERPARRLDGLVLGAVVLIYAANTLVRLGARLPLDGMVPSEVTAALASLIPPADFLRGLAMVAVAGAAAGRLFGARGPLRRLLGPVLVAGAIWSLSASVFYFLVPLMVEGVIEPPSEDVRVGTAWALNVVRIFVPIAIYVGILRLRRERGAVADAIAEIAQAPGPGRLEGALRDAMNDASLRVFSWRDDRETFVDAGGRPLDPAAAPPVGRAILMLTHEGRPLAAIEHDSALREEPGLLAAVEAAVRLTVSHERLEQEVARQLEEVRSSRARIVAATDDERRRIERDLHDGAQQRLVALALRSRRAADGTSDPEAAADLRRIEEEVIATLHDIRELAAGIHPAILTEIGLRGALEALAARSGIPVTLDLSGLRPVSPTTEATAYFVVAEALTNAAKHASARTTSVDAAVSGDRLIVRVSDDGVGRADPMGSGLRGLADRVAAVGGSLRIESPSGSGTHIVAELPCVS